MSEWDSFRDRILAENPETRRGYERLGPLYELVAELIALRKQRGLSQEELARAVGKQQPAIARFESARVTPTWEFLLSLADALDATLTVHLEPKEATVKKVASSDMSPKKTGRTRTQLSVAEPRSAYNVAPDE